MALEQVAREVKALAARAHLELAARVQTPAAAELNQGLQFAPGARVLDLITGLEGEVVDATASHVIVSTSESAAG